MNYWKLGCRWGAKRLGFPLFLDILQKHKMVISWEDRDYGINNPILLTDGHTSLAFAITKSAAKTLNEFPHIIEDLEEKKISMDYGLRIYDADIKLIPEHLQFQYSLVQGICEIQQQDAINKFKKVISQSTKLENFVQEVNLLNYKKQIILQGPPGTGKTREAKELARQMLGLNNISDLENNDQFKLIQFHPSYTYEDFVRGIVAKPDDEGTGLIYDAENRIFAKLAKEASINFYNSSGNETNKVSDVWIEQNFEDFKNDIEGNLNEEGFALSDKINIFKVRGKDFLYGRDWKTPGHLKFEEFRKLIKAVLNQEITLQSPKLDKEKFVHSHYRFTYYNSLLQKFFEKHPYNTESQNVDPKNYVLVVDEINRANLSSVLGELIYALEYRGEEVESMYEVGGSQKLILPPNLYVIGTMNTADRSVGHIDYAIRRRFAFVDVLPKNLKKEDGLENFDETLFTQVKSLFTKDEYQTNSDYLADEFKPAQVALGHSYFIDKTEDGGSMDIRLEFEIKPILREYVKDGILKPSTLEIIENLGK
ncbi:AAA family ATPase [Chryseobacterium sp. JJR-5R]|uniref:AAA family ATPase n=1 Tax=Chryseobacterium sp. JJR-5R TaxID=3093923 RepID=UPI002A7623F8|nr:AAA family ATPase [Chryseobacterium sp. JJR-5R]WPO84373.1 AAA family ATPase [Chryseobacterium sp. JJR-5R]